MDFMHRNVGQIIVASAIIDDTIGWIIMAIIFGIVLHGEVDAASLASSVFGTSLFLVASFTIGRRVVASLIRWANDYVVSEVPVITTILIVMGGMSLVTCLIGVHTILGAFVAGILVGQSPILTRHIERHIDEQLRGLITALFMPLFFAAAGLSANLAIIEDPSLLLFVDWHDPYCQRRQIPGGIYRRQPWRPDTSGVLCSCVWNECTRFDRSHRRLDRPIDRCAQSGTLYHHRLHGRCHDLGHASLSDELAGRSSSNATPTSPLSVSSPYWAQMTS
jgi:hypothetical protein